MKTPQKKTEPKSAKKQPVKVRLQITALVIEAEGDGAVAEALQVLSGVFAGLASTSLTNE